MDAEDRRNTAGISRRESMTGAGMLAAGALFGGRKAEAGIGRVEESLFRRPIQPFAPDAPIRVAMIGVVGHASIVLGAIPSLEHVTLAAISDLGSSQMDLPPGAGRYDGYEEMLDREKPDVVGVCLPYYQNAAASIAAAARGCHVITEKPVATNLADYARLLDTVVSSGVRLTAMHNMRMMPVFRALHDAVRGGRIGEPILATGQKSYKFGAGRPWFYKREETYGGTIPWVGIHALDYIRYTTGLSYTDVFAYQGNRDHPDYPGFQDYAGMTLRFDNGGAAMINIDYLRPETAPTHGDDRLRVIGSEGVVEIKDLATRVELITQSEEPVDLELPEERSFFGDFIGELRGGPPHVVPQADAFEMTRVALIAHRAAGNMEVVSL